MKIYNKYLSLLFAIVFNIQLSAQKGHEIKVKIPNLKNKTLLLGHYFGNQTSLFADDTIKLDSRGIGSFKGGKPLPQGLYFILLPSKIPIDILLGENQHFSLETDTVNFLETLKFNSSKECTAFQEVQKFNAKRYKEHTQLLEKYKTGSNTEKDSIKKIMKTLNQRDDEYISRQISNLPANSMLSVFLKAMQEIKVPDFPRDEQGKVMDSAFQYKFVRSHYFDNFDYADARLLRTPFFEQKIKTYLDNYIPPIFDTINTEVDKLLDKTLSNDELFRYILVTLYNYYGQSQIVGMDGVWVHIAEKYYIPYARWNSKDQLEKIKKDIEKLKPTLIGKQAPNLKLVELPADHFIIAKTDTALKSNPNYGNYININNIKAKFLIIVFWEADCGHCQKAIPLLHEVYQKLKDKGAVVLAVHAISSIPGKRKWIDFVNEHEMYDWINAWSPFSYEYHDLYNIQSFPAIFILDENKKIISKRIGAEQVEEVINFEMRRKESSRK